MLNKQYYRNLPTVRGYVWGGYLPENGLHMFQRGSYREGFYCALIADSDIEDGSYLYMLENDLTRIEY